MTRCWLASAVFAATLIAPCGAAAQVTDGRLGSACASDLECAAAGLLCYLPSAALGAPGPAGGLCTAPCVADADCPNGTAVCLGGVCLEGCAVDSWFGAALDPGKCHGRQDMACSELDPANVFTALSAPACTPRCTSDAQCGADLFCNLSTGLCQAAPAAGDAPGTRCDSFSPNTCAGLCNGVCLEPCVLGASVGCSASNASSSVGSACLIALGGRGVGDLGACVELCNCSSDCPGDAACGPWDFGGRFDAAGACAVTRRIAGAPDCLDGSAGAGSALGCAYGPIRSCRINGCLGTADCLPSGEYSACQCLSSADGGSSGDASAGAGQAAGGGTAEAGAGGEPDSSGVRGATPESGCGCGVAGRRADSSAFTFLGLLISMIAQRAASGRRWRRIR
jgi:hypothetical protein